MAGQSTRHLGHLGDFVSELCRDWAVSRGLVLPASRLWGCRSGVSGVWEGCLPAS